MNVSFVFIVEGKQDRSRLDVIFIYKRDKFGKGLPLYHVDRYIKETEETFGDGSHII